MEQPRANTYRVRERISHDLGTAVNSRRWFSATATDDSGTGVGFTRDPSTGENVPYGDFLVNAQGEDVVAGIGPRNTRGTRYRMPTIYDELLKIFARPRGALPRPCATPSSRSSRASSDAPNADWQAHRHCGTRMAVEIDRRPRDRADRGPNDSIASPKSTSTVSCTRSSPTTLSLSSPRVLGAYSGCGGRGVCFSAARAVELAAAGQAVILVGARPRPTTSTGCSPRKVC